MIVPVAIACVMAVLALRHRSIAPLGDLRFRSAWLVLVALGLQVGLIEVAPGGFPDWASSTLHLASYAAALTFVWCNRRYVGLVALGVGGALNLAVIAANGGVMPASAGAVQAAGLRHDDTFQNSAPVDDPVFEPLGDVFALPEPLPLANVFSVGDVLVVVGAGILASQAYRRDSDGIPDDVPAVAGGATTPDVGGRT